MVNLVDAAYTAVMAVVAHCLSIGGMLTAMLSRIVPTYSLDGHDPGAGLTHHARKRIPC